MIKGVLEIAPYEETGELTEIMYLFMSSLWIKEHEQLYLATSIMWNRAIARASRTRELIGVP